MKFQKLVLFLIVVNFANISCTMFIEKAAFVANSAFKDIVTSLVWWHDEPDHVADFIKLFHKSIVVVSMEDNDISNDIIRKFQYDKMFTQTVFIGAEIHELEYFVSLLYPEMIKPIRLIVVLTKVTYTNAELKEIMEFSWKNDIADIVVITSTDDSVMLTTYFPYKINKCGDVTPVHLHHNTRDFFPKKFVNFYGCGIKTALVHMSPYSRLTFENDKLVSISGLEGQMLNIIFNILNATIKITSAKDHGGLGTLVNGTATGIFADLVHKKADIAMPALFITKVRYSYVQFCHSHAMVNLIWFGPRRREMSEMRVLQPFLSQITPAIFSTSIVFTVITMVINRLGLYRYSYRDSVLFQTFVIFLGIAVNFETKSLLTNFLFVLWIWFSMVVRIAYQGDLVNGLQKTTLESPLRTFESAVKLVDGYGGNEIVRDFFEGTPYDINFEIVPLKNHSLCLKAIEAGRRFLIASDRMLGLDTAPNIQILDDEPISTAPLCFCMRPGWPAFGDIDNVIVQMIEKGFVEKVWREYFWELAKATDIENDRGAKPLTLETLMGCLYGLGFMYGVCTLVLFAEIVYHRMKLDNRKTFFKRN